MTDEQSEETSSELELYAEALLTEYGPVPKIGIKLRRSRKVRVGLFGRAAAERANLSVEELTERVASSEDERVLDVFDRALQRAAETSDEQFVDALGRLVGAALDDALIDEASFWTSQLLRLEPVHLRLMFAAMRPYVDEAGGQVRYVATFAEATGYERVQVDVDEFATSAGLSDRTTYQVLRQLEREGLFGVSTRMPETWGLDIMRILFPRITGSFSTVRLPPV